MLMGTGGLRASSRSTVVRNVGTKPIRSGRPSSPIHRERSGIRLCIQDMYPSAVTDRVQFRADRDDVGYLRARGVNANELARDLFEREVRRLRAEDRHARLQAMQVRMPEGGAEMVREDREGRERWRPAGL